jgi:chromosome segregation ATPase
LKNLGLVKDRINDIAKTDLSKIKAGGADAGVEASTENIQKNTRAIQNQSKAMAAQSSTYYPALLQKLEDTTKKQAKLKKQYQELATKNADLKKQYDSLLTALKQGGDTLDDYRGQWEQLKKASSNLSTTDPFLGKHT